MRSRIATLSLAGLLMACADSTSGDPVSLSLDFCETDPALWFAYQNEGAGWTRVVPDANGTVTFLATPRVAIAFTKRVNPNPSDPATNATTIVYYAHANELAPLSGKACVSHSGSKTVRVSATGLAQFEVARTYAHRASWPVSGSSSPLLSLPDEGALDIVSVRDNSSGLPASVIVRRDLELAHEASAAPFAFGSAEAVPVTRFALTASQAATWAVLFWTNVDGPGVPTYALVQLTGTGLFPAIPASLTQPGDVHDLHVHGGTGGAHAAATVVFREPEGKSVTFGPGLPAHTFTKLSGSVARFRLVLPSQSAYGGMAAMSVTGTHTFLVVKTAAHGGGTPASWDLTMPDLTGIDGWNSQWNLIMPAGSPSQVNVHVVAYDKAALTLSPPSLSGFHYDQWYNRWPFPVNTTTYWARRSFHEPP